MLILTRRVGESLVIGDEVTLMVLGVKGNQVRIGVNAPKHIAVHREEIFHKIQKERLGRLEELEQVLQEAGHQLPREVAEKIQQMVRQAQAQRAEDGSRFSRGRGHEASDDDWGSDLNSDDYSEDNRGNY